MGFPFLGRTQLNFLSHPRVALRKSNLIQAILAVAAVWLSIETSLLRRQAREQVRLSLIPTLLTGPCTPSDYVAYLRSHIRDEAEFERRSREAIRNGKELSFALLLQNLTDKLAIGATAICYNAINNSFLIGGGKDVLIPHRPDYFLFFEPYYSCEEIHKLMKVEYGETLKPLLKHVGPHKHHYIGIFFKDSADRLYFHKRLFAVDNNHAVKVAFKVFY